MMGSWDTTGLFARQSRERKRDGSKTVRTNCRNVLYVSSLPNPNGFWHVIRMHCLESLSACSRRSGWESAPELTFPLTKLSAASLSLSVSPSLHSTLISLETHIFIYFLTRTRQKGGGRLEGSSEPLVCFRHHRHHQVPHIYFCVTEGTE